MKRYAMLVSLFMVAVAGCKSGSKPAGSQTVPNTSALQSGPQFDWREYGEQTFDVKPSEARPFAIPAKVTRLRVVLTADVSVDAGVMSKSRFEGMNGDAPDDVGSETFRDLPCALSAATKDEARCSLDTKQPSLFVVKDPRSATGDPVSAVMGKPVARRSESRNVPLNNIKVTFYAWTCVANCTQTK